MHLPGCILDTPGYMVTYTSMWVHLLVQILTDGEFSHFACLILLCRFYINLSGYVLIDTSTWIYIWYIHLDIWLHIHLSGYMGAVFHWWRVLTPRGNLLLYRCYILTCLDIYSKIHLPGYIFDTIYGYIHLCGYTRAVFYWWRVLTPRGCLLLHGSYINLPGYYS